MTHTALIVDDEPDIRELIALTLGRIGIDTHAAANLAEAAHLLDHYAFDVCLTDMRLPDGNGLQLVRDIHTTRPDLPVAVITAHGNLEAAVDAMKGGAFDFISKPVDITQLRKIVSQALTLGDAQSHKVNARVGDRVGTKAGDTAGDTAGGTAEDTACDTAGGMAGGMAAVSLRAANVGATAPEGQSACADGRHPDKAAPTTSREEAVDAHTPTTASLESLSGQPTAPDGNPTTVLEGAERLIGSSAVMQTLRRTILKVAKTNAPVWITGESGTGKELIARLIHDNGARAAAPFVAINCGAIPAELMESELFGHVKGSFTGAVSHNDGLFRRAEGGTLFLDEVAELPLHMQVKLLRAIQERSVRPVGGSDELPVDVRILSASHEDLATAVDVGKFRHDLYYRLNVISIRAPALRERRGDIAALASSILTRLEANDGHAGAVLGSDAMERLEGYRFPGNVRELENLLERAVAMSDQSLIGADDLVLRPDPLGPDAIARADNETPDIRVRENDRRTVSREEERRRLIEALDACDWNRKLTADRLGMTYRQFRYRLGQLGIKGPGSR